MMRHPVPPGSIAMLREAQMSGGPQIALNRGPLVTCLCQRVGKDIEVWRGKDKKSVKCYAQFGYDLAPLSH
jgi:hypothetical protein